MDTFMAASGPGKDSYAPTIFDFAMAGGKFVSLTSDAGFVELIKAVLYQVLGLSKKSFVQLSRLEDIYHLLRKDSEGRYVICLERTAAGVNMAQVMEGIVHICPGAKIIVLTQEVDKFSTALLVEHGAHNIITKPISIASFTEKLAFTIAPQGKLSRLIEKGKKFLDAGNWGDALMVAEEILEQKHDSAAGFMIKGDAYKGLEQVGRAEEMYLRAINSAELYITPLKRLAELYEQSGDRDKQLIFLRRLNEISPLNTQRILQIGELEISRGNAGRAEEIFDQALDIAQREAAGMISALSSRIADICVNLNPDLAARYSKKALDMKGGEISAADIATVNVLGISLRKQGKWREAIAEYSRVLAVVPHHAGLLYNMALAYSEGRESAKALEMVRRALECDPNLPASGKNVAFNIGTIFQRAGRNGTSYFKRAYEQDPNDKFLWDAYKRSQAEQRD